MTQSGPVQELSDRPCLRAELLSSTPCGYGLIELVSVMAIAVVLSTLSVSAYRSQVIKAYRSDAKVALLTRAQELERCFTQFGVYDDIGCPTITTGFGHPPRLRAGRYVLADVRSASAFTVTATADGAQNGDTDCGILSVNQAGVKAARDWMGSDSAGRCW